MFFVALLSACEQEESSKTDKKIEFMEDDSTDAHAFSTGRTEETTLCHTHALGKTWISTFGVPKPRNLYFFVLVCNVPENKTILNSVEIFFWP